jgi:hypothetical protein
MLNINFFPSYAAIGGVQHYATFIFIDIVIWTPSDSPSLISV